MIVFLSIISLAVNQYAQNATILANIVMVLKKLTVQFVQEEIESLIRPLDSVSVNKVGLMMKCIINALNVKSAISGIQKHLIVFLLAAYIISVTELTQFKPLKCH